MMTQEQVNVMETLSLSVREHILRMSTDGGCFTGASLSCTDILVYLYTSFLKITPQTVYDAERDYLFLSKGHDVPALYGVLAELDFFNKERLNNHLGTNDDIYWHPNRNIPGIEFHSGSLGHLLSVGMGVAYDCKRNGNQNRIVVIVGDGELNEGTLWEGLLIASAKALHNLIVIVDRNHFQANVRTEELIPLEPMEEKFSAFGCYVQRINGHDFFELHTALNNADNESNKPSVIIADTVRGKGVPSIQERADRWFCNFTHDEVQSLIGELHGVENTVLESETLIVR